MNKRLVELLCRCSAKNKAIRSGWVKILCFHESWRCGRMGILLNYSLFTAQILHFQGLYHFLSLKSNLINQLCLFGVLQANVNYLHILDSTNPCLYNGT